MHKIVQRAIDSLQHEITQLCAGGSRYNQLAIDGRNTRNFSPTLERQLRDFVG